MIKNTKHQLLILLSFFSIYVIWGSTYLAILIGLEDFGPFMLASFRFAIAGVILMTYCLIKRLNSPDNVTIIKNIVLGLIVLVGGQGLLIWAEQYISSGNAAIIVSSLPIWYVILDKKNRKSYFSNKYILAGVIIGFIGIVFLFYDQLNLGELKVSAEMYTLGSIAVVFSVICWVAGTLYHRKNIKSGGISVNLSWQLLSASIIAFLISLALGEFSNFSLNAIRIESWAALFYLAIAGSLIAFVALTWLLTQKSSVIVGTYAYINPMIAVFLGWLVANESVSNLQLFAMLIIIGSAIVINVKKIDKKKISAVLYKKLKHDK